MKSLKDHRGKNSSIRLLMFLLFLECTIVTICGLIMFFMAIITYSPEFCIHIIGLISAAGVPLVATLIIKLRQAKLELNGYLHDQPGENKSEDK